MGINWVMDIEAIGTDWRKPYLTECPAIVILMEQTYGIEEESGVKITNHYHEISTAMSAGMFVSALHYAGLNTVTTTPLNAGKKIRELCGRPENEKVLVLFPIGFPAEDATVPNLQRKPLNKIRVKI
jgi:iodotyrosine deiodinase